MLLMRPTSDSSRPSFTRRIGDVAVLRLQLLFALVLVLGVEAARLASALDLLPDRSNSASTRPPAGRTRGCRPACRAAGASGGSASGRAVVASRAARSRPVAQRRQGCRAQCLRQFVVDRHRERLARLLDRDVEHGRPCRPAPRCGTRPGRSTLTVLLVARLGADQLVLEARDEHARSRAPGVMASAVPPWNSLPSTRPTKSITTTSPDLRRRGLRHRLGLRWRLASRSSACSTSAPESRRSVAPASAA